MMEYGYAIDRRAERWDAIDGDTREAAAAAAFAEIGDNDVTVVYIAERKPIDKEAALRAALDVDCVLENANEYAAENGIGDWHEDDIMASSEESREHLEALLHEAARTWLTVHPGPNVWEAVNVTEHRRSS